MTEEVVIGRRAHELGIVLADDAELETAIQEIKKDYPEGRIRADASGKCYPLFPCGRIGSGFACSWKKSLTRSWFNRCNISACRTLNCIIKPMKNDIADQKRKDTGNRFEASHHRTTPTLEKVEDGLPAMDGRAAKTL
jgi:hypothetical protein